MRPLIFVVFICIFGLCIGSHLYSSDAQVMYETSRALVFEHTFSLPSDFGLPQIRQGRDDHYYSQYDLGLPLVAAPVVWLSDDFARYQYWNRYAFSAYMILWISIVGVSGGLVVLYDFALSLYHRHHTAVLVVFAAGLATPLWVYGRLFFAEGLLAGLLTAAFYGAYRGKCWAGIPLGIAILTRAAMIIYVVPVGLLVLTVSPPLIPVFASPPSPLSAGRGRDVKKRVFIFFLFPTLAVLTLLYHNYLRSGDALTFGYGGQAFDVPFWEGVFGMLFSPGKSVFLYAPPLILSVWCFPRFWRRDRRLAVSIALATGIALVFYGSWWAWHGGWCWGARFLVPLLPLWMLPLGEVLAVSRNKTLLGMGIESSRSPASVTGRDLGWGWNHLFLALTILLGIAINALGVFTDVNRHYARVGVVNYSLVESPIVGAARSVLDGHTEHLGTFDLQSIGVPDVSAVGFPSLLLLTLFIGVIWIGKSLSVEDSHHEF